MYTEQIVIDRIEILEDGQIQVRQATKVLKDGIEIAKTYHRHVIAPGDDTSKEDVRVKAVADAVWTDTVKKTYLKAKEALVGR